MSPQTLYELVLIFLQDTGPSESNLATAESTTEYLPSQMQSQMPGHEGRNTVDLTVVVPSAFVCILCSLQQIQVCNPVDLLDGNKLNLEATIFASARSGQLLITGEYRVVQGYYRACAGSLPNERRVMQGFYRVLQSLCRVTAE